MAKDQYIAVGEIGRAANFVARQAKLDLANHCVKDMGRMCPGLFAYLDVSTCHISETTMQWLEVSTIAANYDYGAFILVPAESSPDNLPEDLRKVMDFARSLGAFVIRIDRDGTTHNELQTFDW